MANSVKLLNWVDPDGDYIKFYTELNSEFEIGERVFIAGGPYDNTTDAINDPFSQYAAGYTVLAVDKTNLSNSVTLNINNQNPDFIDSTNSTAFAAYDPFYTAEDLEHIEYLQTIDDEDLTDEQREILERDNFSNEAWISKNHFKFGEFNGGTFQDGMLGQYKIKNSKGEDAPVDTFDTYFNRKNENNNAVWTGGVFIGGNWQWGEWTSRYPEDQYGKYQQLNPQGGIKDPLDESRLLIQEFNDNFAGVGWNMVASGNFGRIWQGETGMNFNSDDQTITFEFVPFALRRGLNTAFNIQIEINILDPVNSIRNSRLYTLNYDYTTSDPSYEDWNKFTLYRKGNIISHDEFVYVSIHDNDPYDINLDKDPSLHSTYWNKYENWIDTKVYNINDVAALDGRYYICLIDDNINISPDSQSTSVTAWQKTDKQLLRENTLRVFERIFTIEGSEGQYFDAIIDVVVADPEQTLLDETDRLIEFYKDASNNNNFLSYNVFAESKKLKNVKPYKTEKHNNFSTGRFQNGDWFNGLWYNPESWQLGDFQGGDWWNGELRYGRISSSYNKTIWHNGFVNGVVNRTLAGDLFWENGIWLNGTWEGAKKFKVQSLIKLSDGRTNIQLSIDWANMLDVGDSITLSYFKGPNSRDYLDLWTNDLDRTLLEFQTFTIINKVIDYNKLRILLTINLDLDDLSINAFVRNIYDELILDLNYQFARVHNSKFDKGLWIDGTWSTGFLKGKLNKITEIIFDRDYPDILGVRTNDISNLKLGDFIELSNIKIIHLFDFRDILPGTSADDRNQIEFWQNLDQVMQIQEIDINEQIIYVDLSRLNNDIDEKSDIIGVDEYYDNSITGWSYQVWETGTFNSGIFEDVIWKDGNIDNIFIEDPTNTQIKTVWRSGIWKNGLWNNGVFLSGIWENGTWNNGFMTNGWNRSTDFWIDEYSWQESDSVWIDGTWNNGRWIRGMWNNGTFINGTIENAGIDKIEIVNGNYTNGREDINGDPIFSSELNTNNSLGAAPSLVFLDQLGWAQLDQASWYQRDYNVIFKDLNQPNEGFPWNDQMFDILERDNTASKVRVSIEGLTGNLSGKCWAGTSGVYEDKDVPQDIIDESLPVVVIRNIVGISEVSTNVFWVADGSGRILNDDNEIVQNPNTGEDLVVSGYNRIIEIDQTNIISELTNIQQTLNTESSFDLSYDNILKITSNTNATYVYTLESTLIRRVNINTLEHNVVVNIADLQDDENLNLIDWFDFALFPATSRVPETLFIFATFNETNNERFNILTVFPNGENDPILLYYTISSLTTNDPAITINNDIRIRYNHWLEVLNTNNLSFNYVNFKGYTGDRVYFLYEQLPIDMSIPVLNSGLLIDEQYDWDGNEETYYRSQNIQKQRISFDTLSERWIMQSFEPNINYNIFTNRLTIEFVDYAAQSSSGTESETIWFLDSNRSGIFYNSLGAVTPLLGGLDVQIKSIELGRNNILAILTDNITPLIVPKTVTREGFGVAGLDEPDPSTDYIDNIQYRQRTLNFLSEFPIQDSLYYWLWDYPTNRIIFVDETLDALYDVDGEFGVDDIKFNEILFLNKSADINSLVYLEQFTAERVIYKLNTKDRIRTKILPNNVIRSLDVAYLFIDSAFTSEVSAAVKELLTTLYVINVNGELQYSYDFVNLESGFTYSYDIPNTNGGLNIIKPKKLAVSNEVADFDGQNKVYVVDDFGIISSEGEVIFKTNWDQDTLSGEQTTHIAVYSNELLHIMYIVTLTDDIYSVYRMTKYNIDNSVKTWPGHPGELDFTLKPTDIVYTTTDKVLDIKNLVVGSETLDNVGLEIHTENGYVLISKEYTKQQLKGILNWIEYDEKNDGSTFKYGFDTSNRLIRFEDSSVTVPLELNEVNVYGQYMQAFQYGTYFRNMSSMYYVKFTSAGLGTFIIFVDDKVESQYDTAGEVLVSYNQTKKYVRSLYINNTINDPNRAIVNTMFNGDESINSMKDPYGNTIFGGQVTEANYDVIGLWCSAPKTRASIYYIVLDNDRNVYQMIRMEVENNGDTDIEMFDIAHGDSYDFTGFTGSRKTESRLDFDHYYLHEKDTAYLLTITDDNLDIINPGDPEQLIEPLAIINGEIEDLVAQPDISQAGSSDTIFIKATDYVATVSTINDTMYSEIIDALENSITTISDNVTHYAEGEPDVNPIFELFNSFILSYNLVASDILRIIKELNNIRFNRHKAAQTSSFDTPPRISKRSIQLLNYIRNNNIGILNIDDETQLLTFRYPYGSAAGLRDVYVDDGNIIFKNLNGINLSADRSSLLIANDITLNKVVVDSLDGDPDFIAHYNIIESYTVEKGEEEFLTYEYTTKDLPEYKTIFETEKLFNAYYKETIETNEDTGVVTRTLRSPHLNGRVLKNTIWQGSGWNTGSDTRNLGYTAHMVSSTWLGGQFTGSWDTPTFFNHTVITDQSVFIDGVFGGINDGISGVWNDGLFLGGRWVSGEFKKGHFIAEHNITVDSISFPGAADSYVRVNQVTNAKYDYTVNLFKLDLNHFYWNEYVDENGNRDASKDSYIESENRLVRQSLVQIPGLFQELKLEILEIRKGKYQIGGRNEVILLTTLPEFDITDDWLEQSLVYLMGFVTYTEYLHGIHYVSDSFTHNNMYWIIIQSDFDKFDENGRYVIEETTLPYVTLGPFRIECIETIDNSSSIWFDIPLPKVEAGEQMKFLKDNLILKSLDLIEHPDAVDFGTVVSPEQVLVFDRSASGSSSEIEINNTSVIQNMMFKNVSNIGYSDDTTDQVYNVTDIVLIESNLTKRQDQTNVIPAFFTLSTPTPSIINSLIYSGYTDLSLKTSGWLNQDSTGFSNADSTFAGNYFEGDWARITNTFITDDNQYMWIELENFITSVSINRFIFLRGFSGNKARIIGSSFSQPFRIVDIELNRVKIRNPFKLYNVNNIKSDSLYQSSFNSNDLTMYEKTMKLEENIDFTFFYTYASNSAWNGGTFTGVTDSYSDFSSIWNAGQYDATMSTSVFTGKWFGTPFSYYYTGPVDVEIFQQDNDFELVIDLDKNGIYFNNNDYVYIQFVNNIPEPFYAKIVDNKIRKVYPIFYPIGEYIVQITRYRAGLEDGKSNQLILDHNLNIGPEKDSSYHNIFDSKTFNYSNGNTVLKFRPASAGITDGVLSFNAKYVLKALTTQNIIFDMHVNRLAVSTSFQPILTFKLSDTVSVRVVFSVTSVYVWYQEETNTSEPSGWPDKCIFARFQMDTNWHHLYVEYIAETGVSKFVADSTHIFTIDSDNNYTITGSWLFGTRGVDNDVSYFNGIPFDKNKFLNINVGKGHENSRNAYQGKVDHIRFWNTPLNDGTDGGVNEIAEIRNKKYMSFNVKEIDANLTFDDRISEFSAPFLNDTLRISETEYIGNIDLPTGYEINTIFRVEQLNYRAVLFEFIPGTRISLLHHSDGRILITLISTTYEIELSNDYEISITKTAIKLANVKTGYEYPTVDTNINDGGYFSIGNIVRTDYSQYSSITQIRNVIVSRFNSYYSTVNNRTVSDISDNYQLYPPQSNYATVVESDDTTEPGSALVIDDYQEWEYLTGDSIFNTTPTNPDGSNSEIWGTSGQANLDYYDAEIFQLNENGEPVWLIDNVSWQSQFIAGNFNSDIWYAGEMKGGTISNDESSTFVWKWGLNSGGIITDI